MHMNRRNSLQVLGVALAVGAAPTVEARRRVRISGRGLPPGAKYSGPTLSRSELKSCVQQERSMNARFSALDVEEAELARAERLVDQYSQRSVDAFNAKVARFNANGQSANAHVASFNQACANRAYYESDMSAVQGELGAIR
jgi:hypothetical protein